MNFLDLPDDFELIEEVEEDNNLYYYIKPKHKIEECKHCGSENLTSNGFRTGHRHIRDTNYKGKLVGLMVKIPRYTCNNCTKSFTHNFQSFPERKGMTHRLIEFIGKEGLSRTYQDIADEYGLKKQNVKNITVIYAKSLEENNRSLIKTPNNLAVLIIPMAGSDRLFFIDLNLNAILDIQPEVDYARFSGALEMFDSKAVNLVLTEPHIELNKWIDLEIRHHERLIYGPSIKQLIEEEFRGVFKKITYSSGYYLDKSPIKSETNKKVINNAVSDYPEIEQYNKFFNFNEKSCPNEGGFGEIFVQNIKDEFTNSRLELSDKFIEISSLFLEEIEGYDNYAAEYNDLKSNLEKIIRHFMNDGYGYSYNGLRSKVLYGTPETSKPRYKMPDPDIHGMGHRVFETPELISGFSVSISNLLEYIEE